MKPTSVQFRPYTAQDEGACLGIFDSNCPRFLDPSERDEFCDYIRYNADRANYLVGELDGKVIACGGIFIDTQNAAGFFAWGLVRSSHHRQGIGSKLTQRRMEMARELGIKALHLDTSQHTQGYYEKLGFVATDTTPDGYGVGLHRIDMVKKL